LTVTEKGKKVKA